MTPAPPAARRPAGSSTIARGTGLCASATCTASRAGPRSTGPSHQRPWALRQIDGQAGRQIRLQGMQEPPEEHTRVRREGEAQAENSSDVRTCGEVDGGLGRGLRRVPALGHAQAPQQGARHHARVHCHHHHHHRMTSPGSSTLPMSPPTTPAVPPMKRLDDGLWPVLLTGIDGHVRVLEEQVCRRPRQHAVGLTHTARPP